MGEQHGDKEEQTVEHGGKTHASARVDLADGADEVVMPAMNSMRTVVPLSLSLKNRSMCCALLFA